MTLEEAIASYEKSAERYHKSFLHCKAHGGEFYNEEAESNKICYEHDRQLAAWLRELQETRKERDYWQEKANSYEQTIFKLTDAISKQPEIIYCHECRYWKDSDGVYRRGICAESKCPVNSRQVYEGTFFCGMAKRRTDG